MTIDIQKWTVKGKLASKLLVSILAFSFFVTIFVSAIILYSDYRGQLSSQASNIKQLEAGYIDSITYSLWQFDTVQIDSQLEGIFSFPNVNFVRITSTDYEIYKGESLNNSSVLSLQYNLIHTNDGEQIAIGDLEIQVDQQPIYDSLYSKGAAIIITQFFKTTIVSLFILFLINYMVTRHLGKMAAWAQGLDINQGLSLDRTVQDRDELSDVADAINHLRTNQIQSMEEIKAVKLELEKANEQLEQRVETRTKELVEAIDTLKSTQNKLVESEKLASLGNLVAGVAHELNTPIGICVTAQSHLSEVVSHIEQQVKAGSMTRADFDSSLANILDAIGLLDQNLARSRSLVLGFKKLAASKEEEEASTFSITKLVSEIEDDLSMTLAAADVSIKLLYAQSVIVESFANPLRVVIEQLIRNSLDHAFEEKGGTIYISVIEGETTLFIDYRDDGKGIAPEVKNNIFEPFVTTGRQRGQAGIGLHLVHNLVTQVLSGSIQLLESNLGSHFSIEISKNISDQAKDHFKNLSDQIYQTTVRQNKQR